MYKAQAVAIRETLLGGWQLPPPNQSVLSPPTF